jgi:Flp pilus assembly protein TadG
MEAALVLPMLLALALGLVESGNMLENWLRLHKAAQAGARVAVTGQGAEEGDRISLITAKVSEFLNGMDDTDLHVTVCSYPGRNLDSACLAGDAGAPCDTVEVKVEYQYQPVMSFMNAVFDEPITLKARDRKVNEPWAPCD